MTLHQSDVTVTTHVVGFALTPAQTELVRCIAEQGGRPALWGGNAQELRGGHHLRLAGRSGMPVTPAPAVAAPPLSPGAIQTLAYHQLTTWDTGVATGGERDPILSDDGQAIAFTRDPGSGDPAGPGHLRHQRRRLEASTRSMPTRTR